MRKIIFTSFLLIQALLINAQEKIQIRTTSASPASSFEQEVGSAKIKIAYSRPLVRGRKIFGELVPFDKLWLDSYRDWETDRKSTRLNSSHSAKSRMPSSA